MAHKMILIDNIVWNEKQLCVVESGVLYMHEISFYFSYQDVPVYYTHHTECMSDGGFTLQLNSSGILGYSVCVFYIISLQFPL